MKTIPGKRLLMYRDDEGKARADPHRGDEPYLREIAGAPVTAKDFRTLHASALAAEALAKLEPGESTTARKRQMADVTRQVASFLRNTPAITRASYIAPCLFSLFEKKPSSAICGLRSTAATDCGHARRGLRRVLEAAG